MRSTECPSSLMCKPLESLLNGFFSARQAGECGCSHENSAPDHLAEEGEGQPK